MKSIVITAALAAFTSIAPAGAAHDSVPHARIDSTTTHVIADASRLGSASLTSLNGGMPWAPAGRHSGVGNDFGTLAEQVDTGPLVVVLGVLALLLSRPLSRVLRRQEQQRRATALASAIAHTPRG